MNGVLATVETEAKYEGYLQQQDRQIRRMVDSEGRQIPADFSYDNIPGLSTEVRQKLTRVRPVTLRASWQNSRRDTGGGVGFGCVFDTRACFT